MTLSPPAEAPAPTTVHADFPAPAGLRTRGTVLVVPGRGETPTSYGRLGRRLAADAYRVRVLSAPRALTDASDPTDPADVDTALAALDSALTAAVTDLATEGAIGAANGVDRPLVLLGADLGAALLLALLAQRDPEAVWWPAGVVAAGLPAPGARVHVSSWEEQLDARTACPLHRAALTEDTSVARDALATPVPSALLTAAYDARSEVPHLILLGGADPLADPGAVARTAAGLQQARLAVVAGGRHDVLNDAHHRSVAAEVVSFLETLRNDLVPVLTVEASTW